MRKRLLDEEEKEDKAVKELRYGAMAVAKAKEHKDALLQQRAMSPEGGAYTSRAAMRRRARETREVDSCLRDANYLRIVSRLETRKLTPQHTNTGTTNDPLPCSVRARATSAPAVAAMWGPPLEAR